MNIRERVQKLRDLMKEKGMDAYIIPSSDAHQSEYVAEHWKSREWISGFTGSAGTVVITHEDAGLWTDGRYYIQAENQLEGSGIKLFKAGEPGVPTYKEWLKEQLPEGTCVGLDGKVFSVSAFNDMEKPFKQNKIKMEAGFDLVGEIWENRPSIPANAVFVHDVKYAGKSRVDKLNETREHMKKKNADHYLLSSLDDIAWLFNIRGSDIANNPVVISYAVVSMDKAWLFIEQSKLTGDVKEQLICDGVELKEYESIEKFLKSVADGSKILLDTARTNVWLYNSINSSAQVIEEPDITTRLKAVKNDTEIDNLKKCHIRDNAAMVKFLYWLDNAAGRENITEIGIEEKIEEIRSQGELYIGASFDTIAAYKEHAAMMHYKAVPETQYDISDEGFLLVDTGGQYLDGTTDITRTIALGKLTDEERRDFTLVLKGHIGLCTAKFLYGTMGEHLDILARRPVWEYGIDYKCGTGHGVGFCLGVHEGPQRISLHASGIKLEKGMVTTNEPGIYKQGKHGIRIENTILVVEDEKTEFGQFMKFEVISYCPIDLRAVDKSLLTKSEIDWINDYHQQVFIKLSPYLNEGEKSWLRERTKRI